MPHAPQPDPHTRALVPVLSFALTTLLCCAETALEVSPSPLTSPNSRSGRAPRFSASPPQPAPAPSPETEVEVEVESSPPDTVAADAAEIVLGPPAIRVRVDRAKAPGRVEFGITGRYRIVAGAFDLPDAFDRAPLATGSNLRLAVADASGQGVRINGHPLGLAEVTIVPEDGDGLRVDRRRYAGALILRAGGGEIVALNTVDLEDYVAGVLYAEMPERFANEALRAQAVVSRTFALYHAQRGRELRDDQGSQMYLGLEKADASARRIVDSTLGEVLTFDGLPIEAYFHSTCGGSSSSARAVFGVTVPPPLDRGVRCEGCQDSPHARWTRKLARADIDRLYRGALGQNLRIVTADSDAAGRTLRFDVLDGDGKAVDRPVADRMRNDLNAGKPLSRQLPSTFLTAMKVAGKTIEIEGKGFGHGVGLCQYGAAGMAARGRRYREILDWYYPEAAIRRLYE